MKRTGTGRAMATLFLGVMFGTYIHVTQMRSIVHGRELFLAGQNRHFDKIVQHHSALSMLAAGIILAAITVGLYELVAAGIANVLPRSSAEE